jgi:hypothetical protein
MKDEDGETWAQIQCSWRGCDRLVAPFRTRWDVSPRRYCQRHRKQGSEYEDNLHREEENARRVRFILGWSSAIVGVVLVTNMCVERIP